MTVYQNDGGRRSIASSQGLTCLEDKFDVIKEIGDGSFGSVVLARVRPQGSAIARKGSLVAIKTMKKTFDSFGPCLELREVIFLRTLPNHFHLVPALDIFLDPLSKKLHICMEHMDGNLYQLMKARDHKLFEPAAVKSILAQIMSGLEHIHAHHFFHRDIKPENILVTPSSSSESTNNLRRYSSALLTPPSTPPTYAVKIADFGLARETSSKLPYTTYVSTRWYRAPEVLLRAGEYSAPVDIWAIGAMAVEIATLRPLFPGGNEVDQVWRICEVMGSPGNWTNKYGQRVGGGEWKEGTRLAHKLGFQFPKMAPHSIETILRPPHWPSSLTHFVTWCLMWDPKSRPTSTRALQHEYFADAVDPLRPKPISRSSSRKPADIRVSKESSELSPPLLQTRPSWFRRSFVGKESSIPVAIVSQPEAAPTKAPTLHLLTSYQPPNPVKARPSIEKRLTWAGTQGSAPIPILPSIRPLSPLPNTVNAHVSPALKPEGPLSETSGNRIRLDLGIEGISTINRQPSVNRGNGIAHERSTRSTGHSPRLLSPPSSHKENSFLSSLSHLRKRARRISGRNQLSPESAFDDDIEAAVGCGPWNGIKPSSGVYSDAQHSPRDTESAMSSMKSSLDPSMTSPTHSGRFIQPQQPQMPTHKALKRQHSMPQAYSGPAPIPSRTRRPMHSSKHPTRRYEAPNEEEELQNEMAAAARNRPIMQRGYGASVSTTNVGLTSLDSDLPLLRTHYSASDARSRNPYPTPSPPQKNFLSDVHKPLTGGHRWPTPPEEQQSDWAIAALQSVYSVGGNSYL